MRFFRSTLAPSTLLVLAGCSGAPGDSGDGNVATAQSPLEAAGEVQFYATVKGVHTGTFPGESTARKHLGQIPAFRFFWDGTAPTDPGRERRPASSPRRRSRSRRRSARLTPTSSTRWLTTRPSPSRSTS